MAAAVSGFTSLEAVLITIAVCVIAIVNLFGIAPWRRP